MAAEENKALMRRYFDEVWQKGDHAAERELIASDIVDHMPFPGQPPGWEGHRHAVGVIHQAFPDAQFTIEDVIAEGDKVVGRWTMRATHRGEMMGIPPYRKIGDDARDRRRPLDERPGGGGLARRRCAQHAAAARRHSNNKIGRIS